MCLLNPNCDTAQTVRKEDKSFLQRSLAFTYNDVIAFDLQMQKAYKF